MVLQTHLTMKVLEIDKVYTPEKMVSIYPGLYRYTGCLKIYDVLDEWGRKLQIRGFGSVDFFLTVNRTGCWKTILYPLLSNTSKLVTLYNIKILLLIFTFIKNYFVWTFTWLTSRICLIIIKLSENGTQ